MKENNTRKFDILQQYKMAQKYEERYVGVMILENRSNIEYIYTPETKHIKLITPEDRSIELIKVETESNIINGDEREIQKNIVNLIKKEIEKKNGVLNGEYIFADDDDDKFLKDGFIHVPKKFLFNDQETTDNIVISRHPETGEYGVSLIDRKLPPTGWAMAGGMVDEEDIEEAKKELQNRDNPEYNGKRVVEDEAAIINSSKEVGEELNLSDISVIKRYKEKVSTYEVRGSLNTTVTVFFSKTGYDAKAGDDAGDEVWLSVDELKTLIEKGIFQKGEKEIILIPHHKAILKKVINDKELNNYFNNKEEKQKKQKKKEECIY